MTIPSKVQRAISLFRLMMWLMALGVLKRVVSLPTLAQWVWREPRRLARRHAADIASTVLRAGALAGTPDADCLQRSLVLYRELSAEGLGPVLSVGFASGAAGLKGHAWVTVEGRIVGEAGFDPRAFETVARFGDRGLVLPLSEPS